MEERIVDSMYRASMVGLKLIETLSKTESVRRWTGGYHIHEWPEKFENNEPMRCELRLILLEIQEEYNMAQYLDKWSRLSLLLMASAAGSIRKKPLLKMEPERNGVRIDPTRIRRQSTEDDEKIQTS